MITRSFSYWELLKLLIELLFIFFFSLVNFGVIGLNVTKKKTLLERFLGFNVEGWLILKYEKSRTCKEDSGGYENKDKIRFILDTGIVIKRSSFGHFSFFKC